MTPEGRIKKVVSAVLTKYHPHIHYNMPVQRGMGTPMLDYHGCLGGHYFAIETKAPGHAPTPQQLGTMVKIEAAGGVVFLIDATEGPVMNELEKWLHNTTARWLAGKK